MKLLKEKTKETFNFFKEKKGYENPMQSPKIEKVVISVGCGSLKDNKKKELILDRLSKITGQKPSPRGAKVSIANFKTRQGDIIGYQVTLRGKRMFDFLDRLINIALPRSKDFKGISLKSIDDVGNLTIGIKEHTIFPETADEDIKDIFGLAITIVTTSPDKETSRTFFEFMGIPFKKN